MANVKTQKSRKEYKCGKCGRTIKIGEEYQSVRMMYQPIKVRCTSCGFKRSETVSSEFAARVYDIQDDLSIESQDDIDSLVSELEDLESETRDKYDNMPEGLQQGDVGMLLESRADSLSSAVSEIQSLEYPESIESIEEDCDKEKEDFKNEEEYKEYLEEFLSNKQSEVVEEISSILDSIEI